MKKLKIKDLRNSLLQCILLFPIIFITECNSQNQNIEIYNGCGRSTDGSKGCFGLPKNCVSRSSCDFLFTFRKSSKTGTEESQFDLELMARNVGTTGGYVAVGFSENQEMDADSVFGCYLSAPQNNQEVKVKEYYIPLTNRRSVRAVPKSVEINHESSYENGTIICKFPVKSRIDLTAQINTEFNLDKDKLFLLLAGGESSQESKEFETRLPYHATRAASSTKKVSLLKNVIVDEDDYDGCGSTVGCFGLPVGCITSHNCDIFVKYSQKTSFQDPPQEVKAQFELELIGKIIEGHTSQGYIAVGLSHDSKMESDAVFGCFLGGKDPVGVGESGNAPGGQWNQRSTHEADESNIIPGTSSGFYENGLMKCKFTIKSSVDASKDAGTTFDLLKQKPYLLLARGRKYDPKDGHLSKHDSTPSDKGVSYQARNFTGPYSADNAECGVDELNSKTEEWDGPYDDYQGCGDETSTEANRPKGCFGLPRSCIVNKNCEMLVKYYPEESTKENDTLMNFELMGKNIERTTSASGYVAVGLSDNGQMNADSVFGCYRSCNKVQIGEFFNMKDSKANQGVPRNPGENVVVIGSSKSSYADGILRCSFAVRSIVNLTHVEGHVINLLEDTFFLLLARGSAGSSARLDKHPTTSDRGVSELAVSLKEAQIVEEQSPAGIELHGLLLIVSWVFLAPIGMFTARYFKQTFTDFKPNRKAFWFGFHQVCMFGVMAFTVVGILTIFLHVKGYSDQTNETAQIYHPILGFLVLGLTLLQVLISFCRPEPTARKRYIFNWIHWTMGTGAHVAGIACIYLANDLTKSNLHGQSRYWHVVTYFVVFHLIMHGIMSYHTRYSDRKREIDNEFRAFFPGPMRSTLDSDEVEGTAFRAIILILEILGTAIAATLLCSFVFDAL